MMEADDFDMVPQSPKAVDYGDQNSDLEDFDDDSATMKNSNRRKSSGNTIGDIILPSCAPSDDNDIILPSLSAASEVFEVKNEKSVDDSIDSSKKVKDGKRKKTKEYSETDRTVKQYQKFMKKKINSAQLKELFPAFEPEKSLRFLKLFEHSHHMYPNPFRWLSNKKKSNKYGPFIEKPAVNDVHKLKPLREARPEEIAIDEEKTSLAEMSWCVEAEIAEEELKEEKPKKIPNWRNGPAKLWYDILGVPEDGAGFHYGFKLKPEIQKEFDEMDEDEREKRIEEDNKDRYVQYVRISKYYMVQIQLQYLGTYGQRRFRPAVLSSSMGE